MGRRRTPWLGPVLGAIVAVLLVVGATTWLSHRGAGSDGGSEAGAATQTGPLPPAKEGYRWVSWRNVAVQVPADWIYGHEPGSDWCADTPENSQPALGPYVALGDRGAVLDIGCFMDHEAGPKAFGPAPPDRWRMHVMLQAPDKYAGDSATYKQWRLSSRVVDGVEVKLLTDDADKTRGILATARTFSVDQNDCAPTSKIQTDDFEQPTPGYDVRQLESVDSISVCQYQKTGTEPAAPALMASRTIAGSAATDLLHGLQSAPEGGGPDRPQNCMPDMSGDDAIELLLHAGDQSHSVYLYYSWCFGNGTTDGTTLRALTSQTCAPVFGTPVVAWGYQSNLDRICSNRE